MGYVVDTKFIHDALGLSVPEKSESYGFFRPAKLAKKNGLAFLFASNSDSSEEELADIAIARGATLLCSTRQIKDYPCLIVDDLYEAWVRLSAACRNRYDVEVVGVTGSIGKTTTKEFMVAIFKAGQRSARVRTNQGNLNLMCWAGIAIQGLRKAHKFYIQEVSESPAGNAASISKMIRPNISVITKVSESHMEKLGTMENVTKNCFGITESMSDDGTVVINADDGYQMGYKISLNTVTYGIKNPAAQYRAINIQPIYHVDDFGIDFDVAYEGQTVSLHINFLGEHNVYCALAAFATAKLLGLGDAEIQKNILNAKPKDIRQNLVNIGSYSLYFDCYNANVESTKSALKTLSLLKNESSKCRRIAVLGNIQPLDPDAVRAHQSIGKLVIDSQIDVLITCGGLAKMIADVVRNESAIEVFSAENITDAANILQGVLKPNDIVLFKSSNVVNLELIADQLFGTNFYENAQKIYNEKAITLNQYATVVYPKAHYAKVIEYNGQESVVSLPSSVNDQPVWCLGEDLFANNQGIEKVELPNSIVRIEPRAFYKCRKLRNIKLSANLKNIEAYVFAGCWSLTTASVPEGIVIIGEGAFIDCKELRDLKLPMSLQVLGDRAFQQCSSLQRISFPDHLKKIPTKAFAGCTQLSKVVIPHQVAEIANDAFAGCAGLTIVGEKGSYAQQYASLHQFEFLTYQEFQRTKKKFQQLKRKITEKLKNKKKN